MKEFGGWQFPDGEEHLIEWLRKTNEVVEGRQRYQGKKQDAAMRWCKQYRVAIDVGAHIGLWAFYLAKRFETVHAFEPVAAHRQCFLQNVIEPDLVNIGHPMAVLHACALGEKDGAVSIRTAEASSGDSWVDGSGDIPMKTLDSFGIKFLDFLKADCEGYELFALRGAEETLKRCRPCVIVEQKPGHAQKFGLPETGAVDYLQSLGAVLRAKMSGDFIFSWPD